QIYILLKPILHSIQCFQPTCVVDQTLNGAFYSPLASICLYTYTHAHTHTKRKRGEGGGIKMGFKNEVARRTWLIIPSGQLRVKKSTNPTKVKTHKRRLR